MKRIFALVVSAFMVFALSTGTAEARKGWDRRAEVTQSNVKHTKKANNQRKGWDRKVPNKRKGWDLARKGWDRKVPKVNNRKGWDLARKGWD